MKKIPFSVLFLFLVYHSQGQDSLALKYSNYIQPEIIRSHLSVLASDSLEGRETSKTGMKKAADYVSGQFAAMGILPCNKGSYFQEVPLVGKNAANVKLAVSGKELKFKEDFYSTDTPFNIDYSSNEVIFLGYGIEDSLSGWNDYKNRDVSGKTIMILDGEPVDKKGWSLISKTKEGSKWKENRNLKAKLAKEKNATVILFINSDFDSTFERYSKYITTDKFQLLSDTSQSKSTVVSLSRKAADEILKDSRYTLEKYEHKISGKQKPLQIIINKPITIQNNSEKTFCRNVLGYIEGTTMKDEVVIITAHLDHLGKKDGEIYHGADDDGSGSSSILNIASAFEQAKKEGHGPARSILIMTFTGEEKGLLGSEYYTSNPVFPLESTVVDLNIDMIGRVDTITRADKYYTYIIGSNKLSTQLHTLNEAANKFCCNLELDYRYNDPGDRLKLYYRSDHYNFAKHNIPVIFYFTGIHEDYHKPSDTINKIDFDKTARIARLVFNTAWEIANRKERIQVDVQNDFK